MCMQPDKHVCTNTRTLAHRQKFPPFELKETRENLNDTWTPDLMAQEFVGGLSEHAEVPALSFKMTELTMMHEAPPGVCTPNPDRP